MMGAPGIYKRVVKPMLRACERAGQLTCLANSGSRGRRLRTMDFATSQNAGCLNSARTRRALATAGLPKAGL